MARRRPLLMAFGLFALGLVAGFDAYRPMHAERILRLEHELEDARGALEDAGAEIEDLTIRLREAEGTLELEQRHREEAEARAEACEGR